MKINNRFNLFNNHQYENNNNTSSQISISTLLVSISLNVHTKLLKINFQNGNVAKTFLTHIHTFMHRSVRSIKKREREPNGGWRCGSCPIQKAGPLRAKKDPKYTPVIGADVLAEESSSDGSWKWRWPTLSRRRP